MASGQTAHYGLSQWEPEDSFLREDFNQDLARIDTALAEKAGEKPKQDRNNRKERFNKKERPQREPREHKEYIDTNKIMVNRLSWGTSSEGLREAFAKFGDIEECLVLTDRQTGKSRGMGIVRFATEESMNKAIEEMNNTVWIVIG